jgi:hypothetical protein
MVLKLFLTQSKVHTLQVPETEKLHGEWSELHTMNETIIYIVLPKHWI